MKRWLRGARPRTLVAAVCPVLVGTAAAASSEPLVAWRALAALVVALGMQVGVNYANDYSDGVRGTDRPGRLGPTRLVAAGLATPAQVRLAAAVDLRLVAVGAAAIAAALLYTGGPRPYGYRGLGELSVLLFFGLVATTGSAYVQLGRVPAAALVASVPVGLGAVALLLANNIRDLDGDRAAGKRTLAVLLGRGRARALFAAVVLLGLARPPVLAALAAAPLAVRPLRLVREQEDGPSLLAALAGTARLQLVLALLLAAGLWLS